MDNLIRILRSFSKGKEDERFIENVIELLRDKVMTNVEGMYELGLKLQDNRVIFPPPWDSIYASLKKSGSLNALSPLNMGETGQARKISISLWSF